MLRNVSPFAAARVEEMNGRFAIRRTDIVVQSDNKRRRQGGTGAWKQWTGPELQRCAFGRGWKNPQRHTRRFANWGTWRVLVMLLRQHPKLLRMSTAVHRHTCREHEMPWLCSTCWHKGKPHRSCRIAGSRCWSLRLTRANIGRESMTSLRLSIF